MDTLTLVREWPKMDRDRRWEVWSILTPTQRDIVRDNSGLSPQLVGLEGERVEVVTQDRGTLRFWVGKSTGWRPVHLEIKRSNSSGGEAAEQFYKSVRVITPTRRVQ